MFARRATAIAALLALAACSGPPLIEAESIQSPATSTTLASTTTVLAVEPVEAPLNRPQAQSDGYWEATGAISSGKYSIFPLVVGDEVWVSHEYDSQIEVFDSATGDHLRTVASSQSTAYMIQVGNQVWSTGTNGDNITTYNLDTGESQDLSWLGVTGFFITQVGEEVWATAARDEGITIVDAESGWFKETIEIAGSVRFLLTAGDEVWAAGTEGGLAVVDAKSRKITRSFPDIYARSLLLVDDTIWASTEEGTLVLDRATGETLDVLQPGRSSYMMKVGDSVALANNLENTITFVDIESGSISQVLTFPSAPLLMAPVGEAIWVTVDDSETITVLTRSELISTPGRDLAAVETFEVPYFTTSLISVGDEVWISSLAEDSPLVVDRESHETTAIDDEIFTWWMIPADQSVWVLTGDQEAVARIPSDLSSPAETVTVDGVTELLEVDFISMRAVNEQVWINTESGNVEVFDAATGSPISSMNVGLITSAVAVDDEVWATTFEGDTVLLIDPANGQITDRLPIGPFRQLLAVDDQVWALSSSGVAVIDPKTRAVTQSVDTGDYKLMTVVGDTVWLSSWAGGMIRILDSSTAQTVQTLVSPSATFGVISVDDEVWTLVGNDLENSIVVYRQLD